MDLDDLYRWDDTEPDYGARGFYCPDLKNYLHMGSFVVLADGVIARLVEFAADPGIVRANVYEKTMHSAPFPDPIPLPLRGIGQDREVVQTKEMRFLSPCYVKDVAFVFHPNRLAAEGLLLHGIKNAYFCRFRTVDEEDVQVEPGLVVGSVSPLDSVSFLSFPSESEDFEMFDDCLARRLWSSIVLLQDTFRRMLSSTSQKQGTFVPRKVERVVFPFESWSYLCRQVHDVAPHSEKVVNKAVQVVLAGCARTTIRRKQEARLLVFTTLEQFDGLMSVLGSFILFGVRQMKPKIGEVHRLRTNDIINVVSTQVPSEADTDDADISSKSRVELLLSDQGLLCITLSYGRYQYRPSSTNGVPIGCPSDNLAKAIMFFRSSTGNHDNNNGALLGNEVVPSNIKVGHSFEYEEVIYLIKSIKRASCEVICSKTHPKLDSGDVTFTDVGLVSLAITAYYE
jgi:hypothetical protein